MVKSYMRLHSGTLQVKPVTAACQPIAMELPDVEMFAAPTCTASGSGVTVSDSQSSTMPSDSRSQPSVSPEA